MMGNSEKKRKYNKILEDIKNVKIQGARNVAKAALEAYVLFPSKKTKRELLSSRPTEPMMENVLDLAEKVPEKDILVHFDTAQKEINSLVEKELSKGDVIFTHCHSSNVTQALIHSHNKGKRFDVFNTETRPLFQGRKTAQELGAAGINVTMFVDSALGVALSGEGGKKVTKVFLGADALTAEGVINKVGSELVARIAKEEKIPVYIIADSWKFTNKKVPIEQRKLNEVWDKAPKDVKVKNPAFEFVDKKFISRIITELGNFSYPSFVKKFN